MAKDNNIKNFTATDIEKYHKGLLSPKEMHELEKAALEDPFLADAMDGYTVAGVNPDTDIAELKNRLAGKTEEKARVVPLYNTTRSSFPWMRVAAAVVIIAGAGLLSYKFLYNTQKVDIAQAPAADTTRKSAPVLDSSTFAGNNSTVNSQQTTDRVPNPDKGLLQNGNNSKDPATYKQNVPEDDKVLNQLAEEKRANAPSAPVAKTEPQIAPSLDNKGRADSVALVAKADERKNKDLASQKEGDREKENLAMADVALKDQQAKAMTNNRANNTANRNNYTTSNIFRGQVMDNNNNPLPFANITNTADNVGTRTDAQGNFILASPYDSVMNVQVKALGFENNKLQLRSQVNNNRVVLQEDKSITARVLDTVTRNYAIRSRDVAMTFEEPEPVDGWRSYDTYLANNQMDVPEAFDIKKNSGSDAVELSFEVNRNGEPVNIRVEKSLCEKCDKEAIRLIKEGPKWKRKAKKGKRTTVTVPFIRTTE
jgi:hypothetical protein